MLSQHVNFLKRKLTLASEKEFSFLFNHLLSAIALLKQLIVTVVKKSGRFIITDYVNNVKTFYSNKLLKKKDIIVKIMKSMKIRENYEA